MMIIQGIHRVFKLSLASGATALGSVKPRRLSQVRTDALVRQAKLGVSDWVKGPSRVRTNQPLVPSVAAVRRRSQKPNETVEAYTGNHIGRKRDRTL